MNIEELTERTEKVTEFRTKLVDLICKEGGDMNGRDVLWVGITTFIEAAKVAAKNEDAFKNLVEECVQIGYSMAASVEDAATEEAESATKH